MNKVVPSLESSQAIGAHGLVWEGKQLQDTLTKGNPNGMKNESSLDCLEFGI